MSEVKFTGGPENARLVRSSRRHFPEIRDGFNSGSAAPTTYWRLPRWLDSIAHGYDGPRRYAIVVGDRVVGTCGLRPPMFAGLELAIAIFDEKARGKGIGTFAVRTLCDVAFRELRVHRVELGVYADNEAGLRVYRKCGFRKEAVLRRFTYHAGEWRDAVWMSILKSEWAAMRRARTAT
jgi:RimJ/RimL family protein N-acetyltransferase